MSKDYTATPSPGQLLSGHKADIRDEFYLLAHQSNSYLLTKNQTRDIIDTVDGIEDPTGI
jgi:hypothetical protein